MSQITYENESVVMQFDYSDAVKQLSLKIDEYQVDDDLRLLNWLKKQSKRKEGIEIRKEHELTNRFCYLICNLIDSKKGNIFCKICNKFYTPSQISKETTSPFDRKISSRTIKKLKKFHKKEFGSRGPIHIPGTGGKNYKCPTGHILISVRTWIT